MTDQSMWRSRGADWTATGAAVAPPEEGQRAAPLSTPALPRPAQEEDDGADAALILASTLLVAALCATLGLVWLWLSIPLPWLP